MEFVEAKHVKKRTLEHSQPIQLTVLDLERWLIS